MVRASLICPQPWTFSLRCFIIHFNNVGAETDAKLCFVNHTGKHLGVSFVLSSQVCFSTEHGYLGFYTELVAFVK